MKPERPSTGFEKEIARIHELLEEPGAVVTWDDRFPDPDNPDQPRQVDVSVRRGGTLTLIECRLHKQPQDVKWIEELLGRRISLRADSVIAVSSSGFTQGAIKKADAHGVHLRDLQQLTDAEIKQWGRRVVAKLCFSRFDEPQFLFEFAEEDAGKLSGPEVVEFFKADLVRRREVLELLWPPLVNRPQGMPPELRQAVVVTPDWKMKGVQVLQVHVSLLCSMHWEEFSVTSVTAYDRPEVPALTRSAFVEKSPHSTIVSSQTKAEVTVDISDVVPPPNCRLDGIDVTVPAGTTHYTFRAIGMPELVAARFSEVKVGIIEPERPTPR